MYNCRRDFDEASSSVACRTISPLPIAGSASGSRAEDTAFGELSIARATVLGAGRYPCFSSASAHSSHKQSHDSDPVVRMFAPTRELNTQLKTARTLGPGRCVSRPGPHLRTSFRHLDLAGSQATMVQWTMLFVLACLLSCVRACLPRLACLFACLPRLACFLACLLLACVQLCLSTGIVSLCTVPGKEFFVSQ